MMQMSHNADTHAQSSREKNVAKTQLKKRERENIKINAGIKIIKPNKDLNH